MNSKLFLPILLAFSTVWGVQWYFGRNAGQTAQQGVVKISQVDEVSGGGVVKIPKTQDLLRPFNTEVDFASQKSSKAEEVEKIETDHFIATFTSFGGQLKELIFKDYLGKNKTPLKTVYDRGIFDEQEGIKHCFLLALEKNTPYVYRLVSHENDGTKDVLVYHAENDAWGIDKTFLLYHNSYQIDVSISLKQKNYDAHVSMRPRLFFVAPVVHELIDDTVVPFVWDETRNSIEKIELAKIVDSAWYWGSSKVIFGAENRYFAHTLINDPSKFAQRAYFASLGSEGNLQDKKNTKVMSAVLEGPELGECKEAIEWTMSFYMGPKVQHQLSRVDDRLQDLLSFGW